MASTAIDNRTLRLSSFPDLAQYFKQLLARITNLTITDHILSGIATDALPLRVAAVWIAGFADAPSIVKALRYEQSAGVRRLAIKRFGKCLRDENQTAALWHAVDGTPGLLQLFSELSVHDIQSFCQALGRTSTFAVARESRQRLLTEFTAGLLSEHFPQAKHKNPETRPFTKFYANIVPACTEDFVRGWEAVEALPRAGGRWMDHAHCRYTRERCIKHLTAEKGDKFCFKYFANVFHELPPRRSTKYMSASMAFSLEFLQYLGEHEELHLSPSTINNEIVIPLLRRVKRRGVPISIRAEILQTVVRVLGPRMKSDDILDVSVHGPVRTALDCWNRDRLANGNLLVDVLGLAPASQSTILLETIGTLIGTVREAYRCTLLELMLKHLRPFSKHVKNDDELKDLGPWPSNIFKFLPSDQAHPLLWRLIRLRQQDKWDSSIFTSLSPEHASSLLAELSRLRGPTNFIDWRGVCQQDAVFETSHNKNVKVLRAFVSPASMERDKRWQTIIEERKKQAAREREQEYRAEWARSAIMCSAATGSLDRYEDTLLWARRFNADALTVKELYSVQTICTKTSIALLSGLPNDSKYSDTTIDDIKDSVEHGNRILLLLLETAFQGLREPSFQPYDWKAVLMAFNKAVARRLGEADAVQASLALSEAQMHRSLWQGTLDTLLRAEERCLMDGHEKLNARSPSGILDLPWPPRHRGIGESKCRFVDELAKRRDELWRKHRQSQDPNVLSLGQPWPRGLSFQHLFRAMSDANVRGYVGRLPFLESRAEEVVFANPESALSSPPGEKSIRKAIGEHVDDYGEALKFYVRAGVDDEDRRRRAELAWLHATGPLSESRGMSAAETTFLWQDPFGQSALDVPKSGQGLFERPDLTLPNVDDPEERTEWNPDPNPAQWTLDSRDLEPTCLDCMLQSVKAVWEVGGMHLARPTPSTFEVSRDAFWENYQERRLKTVAPAAREGLVALGLMLVNSKCCPSMRLLSNPFPSPQEARFPALFLDEEFLDREDISEEDGFVILERLATEVPLTLVAELCEAMLLNVGKGDNGARDFEKETLRLLKILVESDRPDLALPLVRKIVIERPDASSWHRHMLTKGLFDRLPSEEARQFIRKLAVSIKTKLQQQAERKTGQQGASSVTSPPLVKITTVTALAQLLARATFVSGDETIDILTDVFSDASHPDIRVAIIQSWTSVLQKTRHDAIKARILDALEEHAVPVASSINERSPMTGQDWQQAELTLEVPEVIEPNSKVLQPVLSALVEAYEALPDDVASQLYLRILLPVLKASAANNRRWMRIFLRKHDLTCDVDSLPLVPPRGTFLHALVKRDMEHMRQQIFTLWGEAVMVNLDPPADVAELNRTIIDNVDLRLSHEGSYWLTHWGRPGINALSYAGPLLHQYLTNHALGKMGSVPVPLLQDLTFRQLEVTIRRYGERFTEQDSILQHLSRPMHKSEAYEQTWDRNVAPVIVRVVELIERLRTPQWQRDPRRSPAALRDTFDMRLWLLKWPGFAPSQREKPDHGSRVEAFGAELVAELARVAASGKPYHEHFEQLRGAALQVHPRDSCALAVRFGAGWEALTLAEYLGVEIAEALIAHADGSSNRKAVRQAGEMIAAWKASADEKVRMAGMRTARMLESQRDGRKKWFWEVRGAASL